MMQGIVENSLPWEEFHQIQYGACQLEIYAASLELVLYLQAK
jgi:hypothetical protein